MDDHQRRMPGKQTQVDFAEVTAEFTDGPGIVRKVWLFSMVLGHSRLSANACIRLPGNGRLWGRFVASQNLQSVLRCHIGAFEGAPIRANGPSDIGVRAACRRQSSKTG